MRLSCPVELRGGIAAAEAMREGSERPKMPMAEAEARAKEVAMEEPMPVPPPEMMMVLPEAERAGRRGEMDG